MKKLLFCAALMLAAVFSSCSKEYDDTGLRNEIEILKDRIAAVEERLTQEVNTLKGLIEAAEAGLAVGVEEVDGGYEVTIGEETFTINHGTDGEDGTDGTNGTDGTVITVVEVDGVYYWAIDGEATEYPVTGNDGEDGEDGAPGQNGYTPEIKDGKWYINGEEVGPAVGANGENGDSFFKNVVVNEDDTVTFTLANDTTITVALAKSAKYNDVKSIKYIPEYSDGKLTVSYYTGAEDAFVVAKYEVIPASAAELIAKYSKDASMQAVYTKTRAEAGELVVLPVTAIEAEEGVITVTATASELAAEFFAGTLEASVRFAVQDDLSGNASEYVAAVASKVEMPDFTATAVAEGYQGVKLTWTEIPAAAYYQIKSGDVVVVEKVEGVTEYVVENLTDTNKYAFTVVACAANDGELTSTETEEVEIWTMYNWTEPVFELKPVENGYQFIAHNLVNVNYAYGGAAATESGMSTIEIYRDNELVYTLTNTTGVATLNAWAGYKRWALNAQDDRKDWTWADAEGNVVSIKADGSAGEVNTVPASFFKGGEYTIKYTIGYVVVKNGHWAKSAKKEDIVATREEGATVVFFENGLNDVLRKDGNVITITKEGTSSQTFTIEQTWNVTASIDNGTVMVRELFRQYGTDWYNYGWYGERSVNGQFESVTLAWDPIEEADKVVIEYLDQTVENTTGMPFQIIEGIKTSPVEFTLTAYKGAEVLATATTASDVYTLPETASGTFNATYSAEKGGWTITGEDFNTTQYATWNCSFNIYEKGSETPVFENPITKNGKNETFTYISYVCRGNGWVQASKDTFVGFHIGDGNWDQGTVFKGLKGDTEYEVRFELNVWPYIYDPNGPETDLNKPQWDLVKIMMTDDKATFHGAMKLEGTTTFTTGAGPAPFEVSATAEGYQGAKVQWNNYDGATGYEVYVGGNKVADAGADATSVVVTDLTDAQKYTFTVKALGVDITADTQETEIYTLCNWTEPQFELKPVDDKYQFIAHNLVNLNYAYGGAITNDNDTSKSTINILKNGELVYTLTNGTGQGTLTAWAGYGRWALNAQDDRKDWIWTDADGNVVSIKADGNPGEVNAVPATFFAPGEYTIEYTIGYVVNKNGRWATANNDGAVVANREDGATMVFFGPKDVKPSPNVLYTDDSKSAVRIFAKEGTASFTVAAPAINWDYVVGAYQSSEWSSPYWNTDATQRYSKLGYGFWYNYVKLATDCKDGDNPANPKDGQRYGLVYSWNNHIFFDIASTEINPETWQPQEGTGCYALLNMIDRSKDTDHIENNYSYYDKNEEAFYISFTLTSGGTVYRHDGKMHGRGTADLKDLQ